MKVKYLRVGSKRLTLHFFTLWVTDQVVYIPLKENIRRSEFIQSSFHVQHTLIYVLILNYIYIYMYIYICIYIYLYIIYIFIHIYNLIFSKHLSLLMPRVFFCRHKFIQNELFSSELSVSLNIVFLIPYY